MDPIELIKSNTAEFFCNAHADTFVGIYATGRSNPSC
jgi:hypothetical protein